MNVKTQLDKFMNFRAPSGSQLTKVQGIHFVFCCPVILVDVTNLSYLMMIIIEKPLWDKLLLIMILSSIIKYVST